MNRMLNLRRVCLLFRTWRESKRVCRICSVPLPSGEYVCEEEACQMRALEGQAMLADYVAELSAKQALGPFKQAPKQLQYWPLRFRTAIY